MSQHFKIVVFLGVTSCSVIEGYWPTLNHIPEECNPEFEHMFMKAHHSVS